MDELLRAHTTPQRFCEYCSDTDANDEGGLHRREQLTFLEDNHRQPSRDSIKYLLWERVWDIKYAGPWRSYLK
jgi:hypothetical protein